MRVSHLHRSVNIEDATRGALDQGRLPSLEALVAKSSSKGKTRAVLITHVLPSAIEYVRLVNAVFPVERIVAVPYSADAAALDALRSLGFAITLPDSIPQLFEDSIGSCRDALAKGGSLIVQEVGGYLAEHTSELSRNSAFLGIVEDTNNGHWRYERYGPHNCAVLSMAQSPLKDIEDTIIGDAVLFSLERILREEFSAISQGAFAGVLGFGKIGSSTATALKGREAVVSIYDINPSKNVLAQVLGFPSFPLHHVLSRSQLVVGCTGQTSIRLVDMPHIRHGAILASASSKRIEFAVDDFATRCDVAQLSPLVSQFTQRDNGKAFYLLNDGRPVNFRDHSILGTILDLIYSELFVCMREVSEGRAAVGLARSGPSIHNEVALSWLHEHADEFTKDAQDKVWGYPETLKLGQAR